MHNPFVPESLEGWSVLHLMYHVRWDRLRGVAQSDLQRLADEATRALAVPDARATAAVQMLGHKADLMFILFRRGFEQLAQSQLALARTELSGYLEATTSYVSIVELVADVEKTTTAEAVNAAFKQAAASGPLKGILETSDEPLVSTDYIGSLYSSVIDTMSTAVIDGTLVHVSSWYDNEMGYSARCVDLLVYMGKKR